MTSQTMIKRVLFIYIVAFSLPAYAQDDSKMIFTRAVDQLMTDQMELSMDIEITDHKGRIKEKAYDILMAKFGERWNLPGWSCKSQNEPRELLW